MMTALSWRIDYTSGPHGGGGSSLLYVGQFVFIGEYTGAYLYNLFMKVIYSFATNVCKVLHNELGCFRLAGPRLSADQEHLVGVTAAHAVVSMVGHPVDMRRV